MAGKVVVVDNYFILHGSRDGDVWTFPGHQTYDRAQPINLASPTQEANGFKSLLWIYGANHNFFNSVWGVDDGPSITRSQQENIAKVYFSALAQGILLRRSQFLDLLKNFQLSQVSGWIPSAIPLVNQYQDHQRLFLAHYEDDDVLMTPSSPVNGSIDISNITAQELLFDQGYSGNLYQQTKGLKVEWSVTGRRYVININPGGLPVNNLHVLALRTGQTNHANNQVDKLQNFTLQVSDGMLTRSIRSADIAPLPYPAALSSGARRTVMQTLRIPLSLFAAQGVNVTAIRQLTFLFDQPIIGTTATQGSLVFDEIQLCH